MNDQDKGTFIVFEGIDGSGKSTQMELLANYFIKNKKDVYLTREPTKNLKDYSLQSFTEDRKNHYYNNIEPILNMGITVICDRYKLSTDVYQQIQGEDIEEINRLNDFPNPDYTIILDCDAHVAFNRNKKADIFDNDLEFQKQARLLYLKYKDVDYTHIVNVSTKSIEEVHEEIMDIHYYS